MHWNLGLLVCVSAACTTGAALAFDALYAFGDSLTDTWREPSPSPLHYQGRWSNGPLWVEYLSERLGFPYNRTNNYARSGAQCDDTDRQVQTFTSTQDTSQALFVVWAGGNDFLQEYDTLLLDDAKWNAQIAHSVGSLSNAVERLFAQGAQTVLVPNTVDVTLIPIVNWVLEPLRDYLRSKVQQFNRELAQAMTAVAAAHPDRRLVHFDFYAAVNRLVADAARFGFTKTRIDAVADVTLLDKSFDGPGSLYLFWDSIHPTTKAHALIADWYHAAVAPMQPEVSLSINNSTLSLTATQLHAGQAYTLQQSPDLSSWRVAQTFSPVSGDLTLTFTNEAVPAFYRLKW
jgi:phospholipase/lecithinase/hemolysin